MPLYLDTIGESCLSVAICSRCHMKRKMVECENDINIPGLRVCIYGCRDNLDPYRLPPREPERIDLRYPRLDADIALSGNELFTGPYQEVNLTDENGNPLTT